MSHRVGEDQTVDKSPPAVQLTTDQPLSHRVGEYETAGNSPLTDELLPPDTVVPLRAAEVERLPTN